MCYHKCWHRMSHNGCHWNTPNTSWDILYSQRTGLVLISGVNSTTYINSPSHNWQKYRGRDFISREGHKDDLSVWTFLLLLLFSLCLTTISLPPGYLSQYTTYATGRIVWSSGIAPQLYSEVGRFDSRPRHDYTDEDFSWFS